jgi:rRNA maturation protein Nop10
MSVNDKLLLVKAITLLYRESLLAEKESNSADLVRTVLESIKLPEHSLTVSHERECLAGLKDTALWMCTGVCNSEFDKEDLLQRLRVNCINDDRLFEILKAGIDKEMDEPSLKRTILSIRKTIHDIFRENEVTELIRINNNKIMFDRASIKDMRAFIQDFVTKLEPYQIEASRRDPAIVASIDIGDTAGIAEVCQEISDASNQMTVLKTGWQDLNNMTQGGFRRGETIGIQALQHNYKTGFSLSVFKQITIYNTPVLDDPKKKPLCLRISFEDSLAANVQFLYQNLYENENGGLTPDITKVSPAEMAAYVQTRMQAAGYQVKLMRVNPSEWTYKNIQNTVLELEANGYEIHVLMLDYLPMIPTTGCEQGPAGHDLRDLLRRMRNFCSARKICLATPWQISPDGKMLLREGRSDFVKQIAGGGYYSGSKQVDQEFDLELVIHIEKLNGTAWLTVQRGKHRLPTTIPECDKYFCLPFPERGSIPDDYGKQRIGRRKVGGGVIGGGEETPFFEFENA